MINVSVDALGGPGVLLQPSLTGTITGSVSADESDDTDSDSVDLDASGQFSLEIDYGLLFNITAEITLPLVDDDYSFGPWTLFNESWPLYSGTFENGTVPSALDTLCID